MSVYDRWHLRYPLPGVGPCKEHSRGKTQLCPTAEHGQGDHWQVRWRDDSKKQLKRNFPKRDGSDPEKCASAFDAKIKAALDDGSYVDPHDANTTLQEFAEDWRQSRPHDLVRATRVERLLRLHVYPAPETPGKTPTGAPAIGHRTMKELSKRPSLTQTWITGMRLGEGSLPRRRYRDASGRDVRPGRR